MQAPLVKELRNQADKDALANLLVNSFDRIQGLNVKQGGNLPLRIMSGNKTKRRLPARFRARFWANG
jgi:hypothetical protein